MFIILFLIFHAQNEVNIQEDESFTSVKSGNFSLI